MDILIIVALIVAAVVLFLLELFVFPGITLAAIGGLACMAYAIYYAFINLGSVAGYSTWAASSVIVLIAIYYFVRWKKIDKVSLKENIESTIDRSAERSVKVGDTGVALTRLALYGRAMINGEDIEVKSASGFVNAQEPVEVVSVTNAEVLVAKSNQ